MKIAIFGASGATGLLLTKRSLAAGHQVTALLRTPETFPLRAAVHVVKGSAFDPGAVAQAIEGADIVLSALGANSLRKEDVLERAVPQIVAAMQQKGVHRIIVLGSAGAKPDALDKQPAWRRWVVEHIVYNTLLKWPVASQRSQYATLSASSLDWTMAMPPMLSNSHGRGRWRIDEAALPPNAIHIAREDVANFMTQQIDDREWVKKAVYISW
jgi:putative NADH-flavin reductase